MWNKNYQGSGIPEKELNRREDKTTFDIDKWLNIHIQISRDYIINGKNRRQKILT